MGQALSGSRNLFALAEQGDLPAVLRARSSTVQNAGERVLVTVGGLAGAGGVRHIRRDGRGQRDQPVDRLRRDVRGHAATAIAGRRNSGTGCVRRAFGPVIPVTAIAIAVTILCRGNRAAVLLRGCRDRSRCRAIPVRHPRRGVVRPPSIMRIGLYAEALHPGRAALDVDGDRGECPGDGLPRPSCGTGRQRGWAVWRSDPLLSEAGRARAESLAAMLKDTKLMAIFTTEFKRTQETAAPLRPRRNT